MTWRSSDYPLFQSFFHLSCPFVCNITLHIGFLGTLGVSIFRVFFLAHLDWITIVENDLMEQRGSKLTDLRISPVFVLQLFRFLSCLLLSFGYIHFVAQIGLSN